MVTDNKELPKKHRIGEVKCEDCWWYESLDWNPKWCERYCHNPIIFRTGLTDGVWGCEEWKERRSMGIDNEEGLITLLMEFREEVAQKLLTSEHRQEESYVINIMNKLTLLETSIKKINTLKDAKKYVNDSISEIEGREWDDVDTSRKLNMLRNIHKHLYKEEGLEWLREQRLQMKK